MEKPKKSPRARVGKKASRLKDEVVSRVKRMLPCEIDEKVTKKKEQRVVHALTEKKEEQEKMNAEILPRRKRIKELETEIESLRAQVENGTEDREVFCDIVKDYKRNYVVVKRKDTGEVVEERIMTADDRQEDLLKGGRKTKAHSGEDDDEAKDSRESADVEDNDPGETAAEDDESEVH
jgi:hypothetical protein